MCTGVGEGDASTEGTPGGVVAVPSSTLMFPVAGDRAAAGLQPRSRPAAQMWHDTCCAQQLAETGGGPYLPQSLRCSSAAAKDEAKHVCCCPAAELQHEVEHQLYLATWQACWCSTQLPLRPACMCRQ